MTARTTMKTDPRAALQAAQTALTQAETRIAELLAERAVKIEQAEGDNYLGEVEKIDAEIARLQASIRAHQDRITSMQQRQRDNAVAAREQQRREGIASVKRLLGARAVAAAKLDAAVKQVAEAIAALSVADDAVFVAWPNVLPQAHKLEYLRALRIEPLSSMRKQRPMMAGLVRELVNRVPFDFASEVEKRNLELVEELETAGLPALPVENAA